MSKFRKRPIIIEAEQWRSPDSADMDVRLPEQISVILYANSDGGPPSRTYYIQTLEGRMLLSPGDWIITGIMGERYPCKPDIFEATYESVLQT